MDNFAIPGGDRVTANPQGTEETTLVKLNLQRFAEDFGGAAFGVEPEGDAAEEPVTPAEESAETDTEPAADETRDDTGHSEDAASQDDPLKAYRTEDGNFDMERLAKDFSYARSEVGRVRNELGELRKQLQATQVQQPQEQKPQEPDWDEINKNFMEKFAESPYQALYEVIQQAGEPIVQQMALQQVKAESEDWWDKHPDAPFEEMQKAYEQYADILQMTHPNNKYIPLIPPAKQLDMLYDIVRGKAAPQAIQQAAAVAAEAASVGRAEKLVAKSGTTTKSPVAKSTGDPILDGLREAARSQNSIFIGG